MQRIWEKRKKSLSSSLEGALGYFDWRLHGFISALLKQKRIKEGGFSIISNKAKLGQASLLIYYVGDHEGACSTIVQSLKRLNAKQLSLAGSTWPEGIGAKVKKTMTKAKIDWDILEEKSPGREH